MQRLQSLHRNTRGATIIEFAIVAPVMVLLIMGLGDLSYQIYVKSILNGAMQKAGRDSAIQGGATNTATIDAKVTSMIVNVAAKASIVFTRKNYDTFSDMTKPEPFDDKNGNGKLDSKECFTDLNGNGTRDTDAGATGQGGADDVTLYTATVTYPRLFPVYGLFGWPSTETITASTLLKNQPYAEQLAPATVCLP